MKTFYIHLRYFNDEGHPTNTGGITIAYQDEKEQLRIAVARCHWNDNFCKRIGRNIASGRLASGDCWLISKRKDWSVFDTVVNFVNNHMPLSYN